MDKLKPLEEYIGAGYEGMNGLLKDVERGGVEDPSHYTAPLKLTTRQEAILNLRGMFMMMQKMDAMIELLYRMQPKPANTDPGKIIPDPTTGGVIISNELLYDLRTFFSQLIADFDHTRRQYPIQAVPPFDINQWRDTTQQVYDKLLRCLGEK